MPELPTIHLLSKPDRGALDNYCRLEGIKLVEPVTENEDEFDDMWCFFKGVKNSVCMDGVQSGLAAFCYQICLSGWAEAREDVALIWKPRCFLRICRSFTCKDSYRNY